MFLPESTSILLLYDSLANFEMTYGQSWIILKMWQAN